MNPRTGETEGREEIRHGAEATLALSVYAEDVALRLVRSEG